MSTTIQVTAPPADWVDAGTLNGQVTVQNQDPEGKEFVVVRVQNTEPGPTDPGFLIRPLEHITLSDTADETIWIRSADADKSIPCLVWS